MLVATSTIVQLSIHPTGLSPVLSIAFRKKIKIKKEGKTSKGGQASGGALFCLSGPAERDDVVCLPLQVRGLAPLGSAA